MEEQHKMEEQHNVNNFYHLFFNFNYKKPNKTLCGKKIFKQTVYFYSRNLVAVVSDFMLSYNLNFLIIFHTVLYSYLLYLIYTHK